LRQIHWDMLSAEAKRIAAEARNQGKWIYDHSYRKWYSPEDFEHIFSYANTSDEFIKQLQIMDPKEGLEAGFKRLMELQKRLQTFVLLVNEYYRRFQK